MRHTFLNCNCLYGLSYIQHSVDIGTTLKLNLSRISSHEPLTNSISWNLLIYQRNLILVKASLPKGYIEYTYIIVYGRHTRLHHSVILMKVYQIVDFKIIFLLLRYLILKIILIRISPPVWQSHFYVIECMSKSIGRIFSNGSILWCVCTFRNRVIKYCRGMKFPLRRRSFTKNVYKILISKIWNERQVGIDIFMRNRSIGRHLRYLIQSRTWSEHILLLFHNLRFAKPKRFRLNKLLMLYFTGVVFQLSFIFLINSPFIILLPNLFIAKASKIGRFCESLLMRHPFVLSGLHTLDFGACMINSRRLIELRLPSIFTESL